MIYISSLGYSLHVSNDQNKKNSIRKSAKTNLSGTTSKGNNAIQNATGLTKVDNHNCRKYDDKEKDIEFIRGTNSVVNDVKKLYKDEFEEARIEYNNRQTRDDRKIKDYFTHVSDSSKNDLAVEIIIELGNFEYWETKDINFKKRMTNVFKEQVKKLETLAPDFKIASAIIHYDESCPHMHIVGVPIKYKNKYGMNKQVGKSDVFTKITLRDMQDQMRVHCIETYNKEYGLNDILNEKMEGRNKDYTTPEYVKRKKELKIHENNLKRAKDKSNKLDSSTKEVKEILDNAKLKGFNKNQCVLSLDEKGKIDEFVKQVDNTNKEYQRIQKLSVTLEEMDSNLFRSEQQNSHLTMVNSNLESENISLNKKVKEQKITIDKLENENKFLSSKLKHFKDMFYNLIQFLINKIFIKKDKMYEELTKELYQHYALDEENYNFLINKNKSNNLKEISTIEKDDFEH